MTSVQFAPSGGGVVAPVPALPLVSRCRVGAGSCRMDDGRRPVRAVGVRGREREAALLRALLENPGARLSTVELRGLIGVANLSGLVIRTRDRYAVHIDMVMLPCTDRRGQAISLGHYSIPPGPAAERARLVLASLEGKGV